MVDVFRPGRLAALAFVVGVSSVAGCSDLNRGVNGLPLVDCTTKDSNGTLVGPLKGSTSTELAAGSDPIIIGGKNLGFDNSAGLWLQSEGYGAVSIDPPGDSTRITISKKSDGSLSSIQAGTVSVNSVGNLEFVDHGIVFDVVTDVGSSNRTKIDITAECLDKQH